MSFSRRVLIDLMALDGLSIFDADCDVAEMVKRRPTKRSAGDRCLNSSRSSVFFFFWAAPTTRDDESRRRLGVLAMFNSWRRVQWWASVSPPVAKERADAKWHDPAVLTSRWLRPRFLEDANAEAGGGGLVLGSERGSRRGRVSLCGDVRIAH